MSSLRMKDIKRVERSREIYKKSGRETSSQFVSPLDNQQDEPISESVPLLNKQEDEESTAEETASADSGSEHHDVVNLLGVDAQRVADFVEKNNEILGSIIVMVISIAILIHLIGWISTVAGFSIPILLIPLNSGLSKRYLTASVRVMEIRDRKSKCISEALAGIRQIKFSASEARWQRRIGKIRDQELAMQWRVSKYGIAIRTSWTAVPILLGMVALGTYGWLVGGASPAVAFTTLAMFSKIERSISVLPLTLTEGANALISCRRIQKHLDSVEKHQRPTTADDISFENASVSWPSKNTHGDDFALRNLNIRFPKGELSVISGKTGSGKSLLLAAILGEADVTSGKAYAPESHLHDEAHLNSDNWILPSSIAYVAQVPWIENLTIKENILFGLPHNHSRYQKVLNACALMQDLAMLPDGELTEIGAKGINLSGGQRWRITFARALYSRAEILVLDDIFSAVDAHVGRHIFEEGLVGELSRGRTRILATHNMDMVISQAVYVVKLEPGGSAAVQVPKASINKGVHTHHIQGSVTPHSKQHQALQSPGAPKKLVVEEVKERGMIKWATYRAYICVFGGFTYLGASICAFVITQAILLGRAWSLKLWTENSLTEAKDAGKEDGGRLRLYLGIYAFLSLAASITSGIQSTFAIFGSIRASRRLFDDLTYTVLRTPLRWLDTVPVGRIMNRFVGDFTLIDSAMSKKITYFWTALISLGATIIASLFISAFMMIPSLVIGLIGLWYANQYIRGARDLKRLEANAKSPIFELYSTVLIGISTIRSFGLSDRYEKKMYDLLDIQSQAKWYLQLMNCWIELRLGILGFIFAVCVAMVIVSFDSVDAALAGFSLSFALNYADLVTDTIKQFADLDLAMTSTERVMEYSRLPIENQSGLSTPNKWPAKGRIVVTGLEASYAPDLPLVLKGITFSIRPRQRIGVVGRTGSGKSSLTLAFFRFLEASGGNIMIDGIDISKIKLVHLRSSLAVIPQDPTLFSGTLRSNLDVFNEYSDKELLNALERVNLLPRDRHSQSNTAAQNKSNVNIFCNLDSQISAGGLNLSQGQRQLICLARSIITRPKIIILDEATSAIDKATDMLIQCSIREQFKQSTLLVIAHRLSTISDFDKILVMDDGRVVEFDSPEVLMARKGGVYRSLAEIENTGNV
ncbi:hypothetical protein NHQ30_000865 [Ciborinia camelliae]|nr:hypothetical protein NHQ30_000865 [Ciborinia camelliae]